MKAFYFMGNRLVDVRDLDVVENPSMDSGFTRIYKVAYHDVANNLIIYQYDRERTQ